MTLLLGLLPWLLLAYFTRMAMTRHPRLSGSPPPVHVDAPLVSVIVPARNEAVNISACVATLINSSYQPREIIVVDDNSADGTGDIARILADRSDGTLRLIDGAPLPPGWLGKAWACWQGYREAKGELLLFTDADTRHDDALLAHAVGALQQKRAALVSVLPAQLMETFWERVVLPHIFTLITLRFRNLAKVSREREPRNVFANGQFLLIRRDAYEAIGGHEALKNEVVEDVCIAQRLRRDGQRLYVAHAEELIETRMYRSLGGIAEGWSKNLAEGARRTVPAWLRPVVPWLLAAFVTLFWIVPPVLLGLHLFGGVGGPALRSWSGAVTGFSLIYWIGLNARLGVPPAHSIFYPLGALVCASLFVRSALRGSRFRWKGRSYGGA